LTKKKKKKKKHSTSFCGGRRKREGERATGVLLQIAGCYAYWGMKKRRNDGVKNLIGAVLMSKIKKRTD